MPNQPTTLHEHARLPGSRIADVDLSESVFEDVNLRRATFSNVALAGARLRDVDLSHVSIEDANLEGLRINGVLVTELFRAYDERA
jgi:uncharacterized protein YjbI with pentapeptide repeats